MLYWVVFISGIIVGVGGLLALNVHADSGSVPTTSFGWAVRRVFATKR